MKPCPDDSIKGSTPVDGDLPERGTLRSDHFSDLTAAIMHVLPAVNEAVAAHGTNGCPWCAAVAGRRDCPMLGLAAATLDLVLRCWRIKNSIQNDPSSHAPRDLHAAVQSGWLSDAESAALAEILGVLDLAATQADAAGISLPALAGIGVAVIDGYRAASPGPSGR